MVYIKRSEMVECFWFDEDLILMKEGCVIQEN